MTVNLLDGLKRLCQAWFSVSSDLNLHIMARECVSRDRHNVDNANTPITTDRLSVETVEVLDMWFVVALKGFARPVGRVATIPG
jgi:hypothetical protein